MTRNRLLLLLVGTIVLLSQLFALGSENKTPTAPKSKGGIEIQSNDRTSASDIPFLRSGERIEWQVVAAGGAKGTSTNYTLSGTTGQTATGPGSSTSYKVLQGFWQNFAAGQSYICGDANGDLAVNISDAVYLIAYIFAGGSVPDPLLSGDANCDLAVNISDAVYLIAYIFSGGLPPCAGCK